MGNHFAASSCVIEVGKLKCFGIVFLNGVNINSMILFMKYSRKRSIARTSGRPGINCGRKAKKPGLPKRFTRFPSKGAALSGLKDQAVVEFYPRDSTSLSLGCLMVVTKEMAVEDQLKKTEIALQTANSELENLANLDGLTQIANRRSFDRAMEREWKRLRRETGVLSLIICDVDDFKAFNDTYGHQAGDNCLRSVARVLNSKIKRPADLAARYGGEEFAVILPNTSAEGAFYQAESFRSAIEMLLIPHTGSSTGEHVTVSFGVSTFVPGDDAAPEDLIEKADEALYQAKESGRNKVVALLFEPWPS